MARSLRQSKILELISTREIETQDDLVTQLKNANFEDGTKKIIDIILQEKNT